MFLFVVLLVGLAWAGGPPVSSKPCPPASRDMLLTCLSTVLDTDHDDVITTAELDTFLAAQPTLTRDAGAQRPLTASLKGIETPLRGVSTIICLPAGWTDSFLTSSAIMTLCDVDLSGNLTLDDWNSPSSCISTRSRQTALCNMCRHCGADPAKRK